MRNFIININLKYKSIIVTKNSDYLKQNLMFFVHIIVFGIALQSNWNL